MLLIEWLEFGGHLNVLVHSTSPHVVRGRLVARLFYDFSDWSFVARYVIGDLSLPFQSRSKSHRRGT